MTSWDGILGERGRSQLGRQEARGFGCQGTWDLCVMCVGWSKSLLLPRPPCPHLFSARKHTGWEWGSPRCRGSSKGAILPSFKRPCLLGTHCPFLLLHVPTSQLKP